MARFWLSNDSFYKTMDKGCVMLKSQFSQKTWYFSENPFVPGNVAENLVNVSRAVFWML